MNKNILLACRDAVIGYDNTVAVNGVSFELERGDYLCIVGENGSGKSTLLKGILGLIPMRGGSVDFADGLRRTDIGYLPQQTQAQRDFPATVREVVLSGCLNGSKGPFYSRADRSLANKKYGKALDNKYREQIIPRALRRSAAEGSARACALRCKRAAFARRACDRA